MECGTSGGEAQTHMPRQGSLRGLRGQGAVIRADILGSVEPPGQGVQYDGQQPEAPRHTKSQGRSCGRIHRPIMTLVCTNHFGKGFKG